MQGAGLLRQINVQVLEDIEDYIMLKAFAGDSVVQIGSKIKKNLEQKREIERTLMEEVKEENDPHILGKEEDRKRKFLLEEVQRPHKKVWNFIQEQDSENFVPHVLRADADPHKAYEDGRINDLFELIQFLAIHIRTFTEQRWKFINTATLDIFKHHDDALMKKYKEAVEKAKEGQ